MTLYSDACNKEVPTKSKYQEYKAGLEGPGRAFNFFHAVISSVLGSVFAKYTGLHTIIILLTHAYHYAGLYCFFPPNTKIVTSTVPPASYYFPSADYKPRMCVDAASFFKRFCSAVGPRLVGPVVLLFLGIIDETLDRMLDYFGVAVFIRNTVCCSVVVSLLLYDPRTVRNILVYNNIMPVFIVPVAIAVIVSIAVHSTIKALLHTSSRISKVLLLLPGFLVISVLICMSRRLLVYVTDSIPIVDYFLENGMDASRYSMLLSELGVDVSGVFVMRKFPHSTNAMSNTIPFRDLMATFIGKDMLGSSSFETIRSILLHELGHSKHFDALNFILFPSIVLSMVYIPLERLDRGEKRSVLKYFVTLCSKASLLLLLLGFVVNVATQICEFRADQFLCSHAESSSYFSEWLLRTAQKYKRLYYYPYLSPLDTHPSTYHRVIRNGISDRGSVYVTLY